MAAQQVQFCSLLQSDATLSLYLMPKPLLTLSNKTKLYSAHQIQHNLAIVSPAASASDL